MCYLIGIISGVFHFTIWDKIILWIFSLFIMYKGEIKWETNSDCIIYEYWYQLRNGN